MVLTTMTMYQACLLHARADRSLRALVSKCLEKFSITRMEWLLLETVALSGDGMSKGEVAAVLNVSLPQITALTSGLVKMSLLSQQKGVADKRARRITLTQPGRQLIAGVEQDLRGAMRDWLADIPRSQLITYMLTMQLLAQKADK